MYAYVYIYACMYVCMFDFYMLCHLCLRPCQTLDGVKFKSLGKKHFFLSHRKSTRNLDNGKIQVVIEIG